MERMFMTDKMRQARNDIGVTLTKEERRIAGNEIYDRLRTDILIAQKNRGRDYITHIPERKVGKSYALAKLAAETGHPIIAPNQTLASCMKRDAKRQGWDIKIISFKSPSFLNDCVGYFVLLKDEGVGVVEIRDKLNEKELCRRISVVGIN